MTRLFSLVIILFGACQTPNNSNEGWQKVFQNDEKGETIFGNKSELINAVRLGYPIRLGWGSNRIEHVTDADFLTIFEGEEVFAQINTIVGQVPRIDGDSLKVGFRMQNHWTKISGTNGYSTSVMIDYLNDTIVGGGVDRYSSSTWYVLYPRHEIEIDARPLWRRSSPNWEKWKKSIE